MGLLKRSFNGHGSIPKQQSIETTLEQNPKGEFLFWHPKQQHIEQNKQSREQNKQSLKQNKQSL